MMQLTKRKIQRRSTNRKTMLKSHPKNSISNLPCSCINALAIPFIIYSENPIHSIFSEWYIVHAIRICYVFVDPLYIARYIENIHTTCVCAI